MATIGLRDLYRAPITIGTSGAEEYGTPVRMADFETQAAADFNAWFNGLQTVLDDNAATNLLNITNALDARVDMLEAVLFNDITTNPFLILFDDLDGVTSTGIWNESLQRIEC